MNHEIEEELRQKFKDETKIDLWSVNGDNDCGFFRRLCFLVRTKSIKPNRGVIRNNESLR